MGGLSASGMEMAGSQFCICSFSAMGLFNLTQNRTLTKKNGIVTTFPLLSVKLLTFAMKINLLLPFTKEPSFIKLNFAKLSHIQPVVRYDKLPCPSGSVSNPTFPKAKSKLASGRSCLRLGHKMSVVVRMPWHRQRGFAAMSCGMR